MATEEDDVSINTPVVGSHNTYLEDMTISVREKVVPWEGYQKAALITEDELIQLRNFEKSPAESMKEAGEKYILLFLNLLQKLVKNDTIQKILVTVEDTFSGTHIDSPVAASEENADVFFKVKAVDPTLPYGPFIKLLRKDDEFSQLKAAKIFALLAIHSKEPSTEVAEVFTWLAGKLQDTNTNVVDIAVQILQSLLSVPEYRLSFYQTPSGVNTLVDILKKTSPTAQMQYQVIYCLWMLTFVQEISADIQRKYDVLSTFIDIAKSAIKEKVVRVIFSTIKNMLTKSPQENMVPMLGNKLLTVCEVLLTRKWTDTEIAEDLELIRSELANVVVGLSTFDEYASEVKSGKLDWSPVHLSEQFWKQNAGKLSEKDYELVRILSRLISTSTNPLVLSVAAHDIGQYVKHCPSGKKFVQEHGTKAQIMELMTHENPDVRYQALLAVQKFMTNAWDY
ncbi:H(+)-transporting V1 sector ATPase subunit H [Chytridiales sp. JEL 0842]|nr:H(+)-transporting V1 sector ATPase subunit H [Chytridiales sp. JEL 0842]